MQRDCLEKIAEWNNSRKRNPIVLMGARQVGKAVTNARRCAAFVRREAAEGCLA